MNKASLESTHQEMRYIIQSATYDIEQSTVFFMVKSRILNNFAPHFLKEDREIFKILYCLSFTNYLPSNSRRNNFSYLV
jgi:hypothetical protein